MDQERRDFLQDSTRLPGLLLPAQCFGASSLFSHKVAEGMNSAQ
jgi:hypothetical protein